MTVSKAVISPNSTPLAARNKHKKPLPTTNGRTKVQSSIDDPRPSIPGKEVEAYFAKNKDALRKRIKQGQA